MSGGRSNLHRIIPWNFEGLLNPNLFVIYIHDVYIYMMYIYIHICIWKFVSLKKDSASAPLHTLNRLMLLTPNVAGCLSKDLYSLEVQSATWAQDKIDIDLYWKIPRYYNLNEIPGCIYRYWYWLKTLFRPFRNCEPHSDMPWTSARVEKLHRMRFDFGGSGFSIS